MFGRSSSVRLFTIRGIRVGVDVSWFVVLFLMIYLLSRPFRDTLHSSDAVAYLTTVVAVLALFASIIVHEFGHAIEARRRGVGVTRIDLYMFGGLTEMEREPATPGEDFTIAAAGPLATVAVILVCVAIDFALVGGHRLIGAIQLESDIRITPVLLALSWLIPVNVLLLAFNLLPAYPLDGGRITRSAVWKATGSRLRGTVVAARLGQLLALGLLGTGVYLLAGARSYGGLYTLLLAWILWSSARGAIARTQLDARVDGVCVGDIMDAQPLAVSADLSADEAMREYFSRYRWPWFAVVEADGRYAGIVTEESARAAADGGEGWVRIGSLVGPGAERFSIAADSPVTDLLGSEALRTLGAAMVLDGDGRLRGVVTIEQVRRALAAAVPA